MQENESLPSSTVMPEASPAQEQAVPAAKTSGSGLWSALSWFRDLAFSVLIAVVLIVFIYQPVKVEGTSMMPTLEDQERIFVNKFTYHFGLGDIHRGDVVVFWYPKDTTKSYIKRVIGVPGDRVRIDHGEVYVNGQQLEEGYVPKECFDPSSWEDPYNPTVPKDEYFVLGDHRNSSSDSRTWGYVPRDDIYGKAVFVYWPLDKLGRLR